MSYPDQKPDPSESFNSPLEPSEKNGEKTVEQSTYRAASEAQKPYYVPSGTPPPYSQGMPPTNVPTYTSGNGPRTNQPSYPSGNQPLYPSGNQPSADVPTTYRPGNGIPHTTVPTSLGNQPVDTTYGRQTGYYAPGTTPGGGPPTGTGTTPIGGGTRPSGKGKWIGLPILALLMGALGGWFTSSGTTSSPAGAIFNPNGTQPIEQVAGKLRPSVVQINVATPKGSGIGSGVIIDPRGYIVTNNHVLQGGQVYQVVLYDNTKLPATLAGTDPQDDLAVIKVNPPRHMAVAKIGDSSRLQVGQPVLAIGNPLGITQTVTSGIVSALGRNVSEGPNSLIIDAIQTDAAINPGNSGGALANMQGDLVGIPTLVPIDPEFKTPASGVGFAIPSNRVKFIAPQLIKSGRVINSGRADMGVNIISVDSNIASQAQLPIDTGALIVNVVPGSPAAQAGLRRGDIIVQADNQPVTDSSSLQDVLINKRPGDIITLQIYRGSQQGTARVRLGEQRYS
ncbi:hypothetical protein KDA_64760 [Dictyobacter alpinus]|uniref:PDZ domain-containing protein n=1 Tax=Dictyobacter alpinus TaxID=2014873 RepID=A0A402BID3_9CHLR|nr:trypsin-like peptidase domain-containing protein [Dictyobacter alpinus]GCE30992.1 hypothetical protein KDA_64760 [Dictyobacter alpinus]